MNDYVMLRSAIGSFIIGVLTGDISNAFVFIKSNPWILLLLVSYNALVWVGVQFLMLLNIRYGVLVTNITSSTRRFFSVLISLYMFPKHMNTQYYVGIIIVFAAVVLNIYIRKDDEGEKAKAGKLADV
eukprot:TRINITY_DN25350_c0_g1_i1.p1 TRINITY_DN25350_c0_g1~~TRINITY_DN25350_c0_g1_i1.p1  ORF type:complete len:128 (+),score=43.41 TRINITY_DN25350_c0_g1_i1:132-515(+)